MTTHSTNNIFMTFLREEKWFKNGVRVEKEDLINVKVLGQIDDKFIAIVTQNTNFLVLLDQHAVDERIRLEKLLARKSKQIFQKCLVHCIKIPNHHFTK